MMSNMELLSYNTDSKVRDKECRMDVNVDDERKRAMALLYAIQSNSMSDYFVKMPFVDEYHSVLDKLAKTGIDVTDFRIPASWMKIEFGWENLGKVVVRELFLIKLQAILSYLAK
jgi:hypothetical protein